MVLSFEQSGIPTEFGLKEVRELALQHGFVRNGPGAPQPDLDALFGAYGCKALSMFKKKFCAERLSPPGSATGTLPPADSSIRLPALSAVGPDSVPVPSRSPG